MLAASAARAAAARAGVRPAVASALPSSATCFSWCSRSCDAQWEHPPQQQRQQRQQRRGMAQYKRVRRQDKIQKDVLYEKRQEHLLDRELNEGSVFEEEEKHRIKPILRSSSLARGPKRTSLGRKSALAGFEELNLIAYTTPDTPDRVKVHHRDLLKRGLPRGKEESHRDPRERRIQRAERHLHELVQETFHARSLWTLDTAVCEAVGGTSVSVVECTRVKMDYEFQDVTVFWRPPLTMDGSAMPEAKVEAIESAMKAVTRDLRRIVAKRMQIRRAPRVHTKLDSVAPDEEQVQERRRRRRSPATNYREEKKARERSKYR